MTETDTTKVRERMDVICSCGTRLGTVDHIDGERIKLTKSGTAGGGKHHFVPMDWVESVDDKVHLSKNSEEAKAEWEEEGMDADAPAGGKAAPMKGGASRGRMATADRPSDTQPKM